MNLYTYPDQSAPSFEKIDFNKALSGERRFLCLDLDNTLLPQKGEEIAPEVAAVVASLRESNAVKDICLISNVIIPGSRLSRLYRLSQELSISHVVPGFFWNRKPKCAPFHQALRLLKAKPEQCVMVGDQIFSDIVGGNRMGFYTVWVKPISSDHWTTWLSGRRRRERKILQGEYARFAEAADES